MRTKSAYLLISAVVVLGVGVALLATMPARSASASISPPGTVAVTPPLACTTGWSLVPSPNGSGKNSLASVTAISPNDVWAVGYYTLTDRYQTLTEHWDGAQWNIVPSPNPGALNSVLTGVSAVSTNDVWAVGWYNNDAAHPTRHLITMHWNGTAWSEVPNPDPGGNYDNYLTAVAAAASNDVWAVGFYRENSPLSLVMHWDGSAWSVRHDADISLVHFDGVGVVSPNDVWAVGSYTGPVARHWDGTAWNAAPAPTIGALYSVDGVASNDVWATGANGVAHWDGTAWTTFPAPTIGAVRSVTAISSNDVWAVGDSGIIHWDGSTWSASPTPVYGIFYGVAAVSSNEVWAVGSHPVGSLAQTLTEHYIDVCPSPTSTPTPTYTSTPCATNYTYTTSSGGSVTQGTTLLPGSQCGRCTAPVTLPFPFTFYGQTYTTANVLSVGNVQFTTTDTSFTSCLPDAQLGPAILPNWDTTLDTAYTPPCQQILGRPCGVYTSVTGSAPNRIFNIEWLTRRSGSSTYTARFGLRLYEGTNQFDFVYANIIPPPSGSSSSVGVQNGAGAFTTFACFVGGSLSSGLVITWQTPVPCGPTYTPTPTGTPICPPLRMVIGQSQPAKPALIRSAGNTTRKFASRPAANQPDMTRRGTIVKPDVPISFAVDDGGRETSIGFGADPYESPALWLNRFTPPSGAYPITLSRIQVLWPDQSGTGDNLPGKIARLLVYQDADGDGNPSNATLVGQVTVTIGITETYENYPVNIVVPGPTGDVYVGFEDLWAVGGYTPRMFPASEDTTASQARSWIAAMGSGAAPDINNLGNNDQLGTIDSFGLPGNWLVRAMGSTNQSSCQPTNTPTATATRTPTQVALLVGHVVWQGPPAQPNVRQQLPITITLKLGSTEVNYPSENTDPSGFFTVSVAGMPGGTYQWRVKGPRYLANSGSVSLTGNPVTANAEMGTMRVGDANNDNAVSSSDFNIMKITFGKGIGDPGYDPRADFTNDDVVNLPDFNLLKVNFGQGGAPPITPREQLK